MIVSFFFYLTFHYFDGEWIWKGIKAIIQSPIILFAILTAIFAFFLLESPSLESVFKWPAQVFNMFIGSFI